ncbi:50S ribosomal protein L28 [Candidatus Paracaedibacter symbiosus]|uniref:50S ribosomal protein L28 n=1 Tax=Candidatus Paracaedibacter symbiosus TaxID=244582 RepID=UPI000509D231|nr:50S ribosomal protein L28 [Candidatus Paracaedibacter symbiosus]
MAKRCAITGKGVQSGNNVSHANNKTRRRFLPNLQEVSFMSETLGRAIRLRISTNAIRTIEHNGGIDSFLINAKADKFDTKVARLKKLIIKHQAEAAK